jgi:hypothetical protein
MRLQRESIKQCIMNISKGGSSLFITVKQEDVMPLIATYGMDDVDKIIDVLLEEKLNPHWDQEDANLASFPPSDYANQDIPYEWLEPYKNQLVECGFDYARAEPVLGIGPSGVYNKKEGAFLLNQNGRHDADDLWISFYLCWRNEVIYLKNRTHPEPKVENPPVFPQEGFAAWRLISVERHANPFEGEEKKQGYQLLKGAIENRDEFDQEKKAGRKILHVFNGFFDDKL